MSGQAMDRSLRRARRALETGGVIAYPTEAVFGLGCDPLDGTAMRRLLRLKGRSPGKGVILISGELEPLLPYLTASTAQIEQALATWPGPVTWLLPARADVPAWLTGGRRTLAVRVTDHPVAAAVSAAFGDALVSTSANRSGSPPARTAQQVRLRMGAGLSTVVPGATGGRQRPSEIRDGRTGAVLRA